MYQEDFVAVRQETGKSQKMFVIVRVIHFFKSLCFRKQDPAINVCILRHQNNPNFYFVFCFRNNLL